MTDVFNPLTTAGELHLAIHWATPGWPEAGGSPRGFWRVLIGPRGWEVRDPLAFEHADRSPGPDGRGPIAIDSVRGDLVGAVAAAVRLAERYWPNHTLSDNERFKFA